MAHKSQLKTPSSSSVSASSSSPHALAASVKMASRSSEWQCRQAEPLLDDRAEEAEEEPDSFSCEGAPNVVLSTKAELVHDEQDAQSAEEFDAHDEWELMAESEAEEEEEVEAEDEVRAVRAAARDARRRFLLMFLLSARVRAPAIGSWSHVAVIGGGEEMIGVAEAMSANLTPILVVVRRSAGHGRRWSIAEAEYCRANCFFLARLASFRAAFFSCCCRFFCAAAAVSESFALFVGAGAVSLRALMSVSAWSMVSVPAFTAFMVRMRSSAEAWPASDGLSVSLVLQ